MGIKTMSQFYYGHAVDNNEHFISIDEGSGEVIVNLTPGGYTFTELAVELQRALNEAGALDYSVVPNRTTRKFAITATGVFDILAGTGIYAGADLFEVLGFSGSDKTGLSTYTSDNATGFVFRPQLKFFDYVPTSNNESSIQSTLNESGDGSVEIVNFGTVNFMECSMRYITNRCDKPDIIELDISAVENTMAFLKYIRTKNRIEFMPDRDDVNTFEKLIIQRTDKSSSGIEVQLYEMNGIQDYFETRNLVFRKVV